MACVLVAAAAVSYLLAAPAGSASRARVVMSAHEDMVPRAEADQLRAELAETQQRLAATKARLDALAEDDSAQARAWPEGKVEHAFDAVDANGDGVLTLDEFRKGYELLTGDTVASQFELMDKDGNGTVDKDEFRKGFALLTSDSARAEAERQKVETAVAAARTAAVKDAAKNLAEAQLMDALYGEPPPGKTRWPESYTPMPGRQPLSGNSPSKDFQKASNKRRRRKNAPTRGV